MALSVGLKIEYQTPKRVAGSPPLHDSIEDSMAGKDPKYESWPRYGRLSLRSSAVAHSSFSTRLSSGWRIGGG